MAVPRPRCGSPARAPQGDPRGLRASSPPPTRDRGAGPCLPGVLWHPRPGRLSPGPRQCVWWAGAGETWKCPRGEARGGTPGQGVRGPRRALGAPSPCGLCPRDPEAPEAVAAPRRGPLRPPCWAASSAAGRSQRPAESEAGGEQTLCPLVSGHDLGLLPLGPAPWLPAGPSDPAPPQPPRPHPDQRPQPPPGARHRQTPRPPFPVQATPHCSETEKPLGGRGNRRLLWQQKLTVRLIKALITPASSAGGGGAVPAVRSRVLSCCLPRRPACGAVWSRNCAADTLKPPDGEWSGWPSG